MLCCAKRSSKRILACNITSQRLITLKKRALRIISRSTFDAHTNPIFASLRILNFEDVIKLKIGKVYLYKKKAFFLIIYSMTIFLLLLFNCDVHSYHTRCKNSFRLPCFRTLSNVRTFSLRFQRPKIFNSHCSEIQNASSIAVFTSKLKLFSLAFFLALFKLFSCTFSFSFLYLPFKPYLFLSLLMIIFYVIKKLYV